MISRDSNDIAIVLFAQKVGTEAYRKRMFSSSQANHRLWKSLNKSTLDTIRASGLDYYHFDNDLQIGDSFGQRISNALSNVFNKGYQQVIVLGNDCPDISVEDINQARRLLVNKRLVIGPDQRGGTYLIGIDKSVFQKSNFQELPWQTSQLFESLTKAAADIAVLSTKQDLNTIEDLNQLTKRIQRLKALIKEILRCQPVIQDIIQRLALALMANLGRRGPPVLLFY